jgi:hypothetical protein
MAGNDMLKWNCQTLSFNELEKKVVAGPPTDLTVGKRYAIRCQAPGAEVKVDQPSDAQSSPPASSPDSSETLKPQGVGPNNDQRSDQNTGQSTGQDNGQGNGQGTGQLKKPPFLNINKIRFDLKEADQHVIKILNVVRLDADGADLIVTSYQAGEIKTANLVLTDGLKSVELGPVDIKVASVLKPVPGVKPESFPPYAPVQAAWPIWVWVLIALVISTGVFLIWRWIRRGRKQRQIRKRLLDHPIAATPYAHFNRELRILARNHRLVGGAEQTSEEVKTFIVKLDDSFRWFLARELVTPAFDSSPNEIRASLRRKNRDLDKDAGRDLVMVLKELVRAKASKSDLTAHDGRQLLELCRKVADAFTQAQTQAKKGGSL